MPKMPPSLWKDHSHNITFISLLLAVSILCLCVFVQMKSKWSRRLPNCVWAGERANNRTNTNYSCKFLRSNKILLCHKCVETTSDFAKIYNNSEAAIPVSNVEVVYSDGCCGGWSFQIVLWLFLSVLNISLAKKLKRNETISLLVLQTNVNFVQKWSWNFYLYSLQCH